MGVGAILRAEHNNDLQSAIMNAPIQPVPRLEADVTGDMGEDYAVIRAIIEHISLDFREQPSLEALAAQVGMSITALQRLFTRWAGLSPKAFLQAVTLDHARRLLDDGAPILDAAFEVGMSGPGRLHDLFVTHEAMSPGTYKERGAGLVIRYGFHLSPFGMALVMITDRGLCGLAFAEPDGEDEALEDLRRRWPRAEYLRDQAQTAPYAARVFDPQQWRPDQPLRVVLIGTDFQIRVWEALIEVPRDRATSYSDLAGTIGTPKASRAVGAAVGANPVAFVVPCHRVIGKGGALTGYHWGLTRKRAILGWEAGLA
jgi:AraC family transcriptional regulator of adaptative response/methylated-DNA-[protein]-cysteine methyltransferase